MVDPAGTVWIAEPLRHNPSVLGEQAIRTGGLKIDYDRADDVTV
jgi:hypothetical protein